MSFLGEQNGKNPAFSWMEWYQRHEMCMPNWKCIVKHVARNVHAEHCARHAEFVTAMISVLPLSQCVGYERFGQVPASAGSRHLHRRRMKGSKDKWRRQKVAFASNFYSVIRSIIRIHFICFHFIILVISWWQAGKNAQKLLRIVGRMCVCVGGGMQLSQARAYEVWACLRNRRCTHISYVTLYFHYHLAGITHFPLWPF